jgi:predicted  nucleic acid-binding Zn-ribbon protein
MSLEDTELKIGGTSFKGVYIAIVLSLATSLGGGVWTASSLYSRLQDVEARSIPDIEPTIQEISLIKQQLTDNDVSQLKAKLAELGTNLATIMEQQDKLLNIQSQVIDLEKEIEAMKGTVTEAKLLADGVTDLSNNVKVTQQEINDLWKGLDYLSNPLK